MKLDRPDRADLASALPPAFEENVGRDGMDAERSGDHVGLVHVDLGELHPARQGFGKVLEDGFGGAAWGAPVGVEIHDDREGRTDDLLVERLVGHYDHGWYVCHLDPCDRFEFHAPFNGMFFREPMVDDGAAGSRLASERPIAPDLLRWFRSHRRDLPWRRDRDPYRVWLAEVLLQQTRVAQALPYFDRFVTRFPTVQHLAGASEQQVLKVWAGAGYYGRARHLREAALEIVGSRGGRFPTSASGWAELPGVGPYIAAAVASLAFGEPVVAMDANVRRIATRLTGERGDVRAPAVRQRLEGFLALQLPRRNPGDFNEGLMELGETVCLPRRPACGRCPLHRGCRARLDLPDPGALPRRFARKPRRHVRASVVALRCGDRWLVQQRAATGLLGGLWEFPGGKWNRGERALTAARRELTEETGLAPPRLDAVSVVNHSYSHFSVELHLFRGDYPPPRPKLREPRRQRWVTWREFDRLPLPQATVRAAERLREGRGRAYPDSGSRPGRTGSSRNEGVPRRLPRARRLPPSV